MKSILTYYLFVFIIELQLIKAKEGFDMEELYRTLYHMLFNAYTDSVNALEEGEYEKAHMILIMAQRACEEVYISAGEDPALSRSAS